MAGSYPSLNDSNFDLLKKITSNTAEIANEADIPPQPGNSGKLLTTNGTNTAWTTNGTLTSLTAPAGNDLTLAGGSGNTSVILTPSGTGNVGIGTASPSAKLQTQSNYATTANDSDDADATILIENIHATGDAVLRMRGATGVSSIVYGKNGGTDRLNFIPRNDNGQRIAFNQNGVVSISNTTAGSANVGALVLQGGISAGNTGSAASYFGGAVTAAGDITSAGLFRVTDGQAIRNTQTGGSGAFYLDSASVAFRNPNTGYSTLMSIGAGGLAVTPAATFAGAVTVAGNLTVNGGTTASGQIGLNGTHGVEIWGKAGTTSSFILYNNAGAPVLTNAINTTTATFAGAVAIGNTVGVGVAVASTHKVTMVIGGVTYYLLASNV